MNTRTRDRYHPLLWVTAGAVITLIALRLHKKRLAWKASRAQAKYWGGSVIDLRPPFPREIVTLLDSASLCYLSTTLDNAPHLSLMNFTYVRERELLVFTTRRDTKKCDNLLMNPRVAILLHDFPHLRKDRELKGAGSGSFSITLYGAARVLDEKTADSEELRAKHLAHNPEQEVFINGTGIAVVAVDVESARVCDDLDQVTGWSVSQGWAGSAPLSNQN
mmetsp:Transcript_22575/g.50941  ORF Transcript_22575/g.50941 Transcript_22575/m.50941 type:complete len:220 (-) Transcript_22575:121-780(-)